MVVYIDTSPYFCDRQTDDVIGAEAWKEAGPGGLVSYYRKFRKNTAKTFGNLNCLL